ncbi:Nn.00g001340.m01.CDS01 [Neocucurbitaria sp. VM-36]
MATLSLYRRQLYSEQQEIRTFSEARLFGGLGCTALSYVWRDANGCLPIFVDGIQFSATRNLALALQYIRKPDRDELLWVDAVCTNQEDVDERNSQVPFMETLYSEAEEVIIWLGGADLTTDELVRVVEKLGLPTLPIPDTEDLAKAHLGYATQFTRMLALFDVVSLRPWWSRVWTVQECIPPRKYPVFRCQIKTSAWENLFSLFYEMYRRAQNGRDSIQGHETHPSTQEIGKCRDQLSKEQVNGSFCRKFRRSTW